MQPPAACTHAPVPDVRPCAGRRNGYVPHLGTGCPARSVPCLCPVCSCRCPVCSCRARSVPAAPGLFPAAARSVPAAARSVPVAAWLVPCHRMACSLPPGLFPPPLCLPAAAAVPPVDTVARPLFLLPVLPDPPTHRPTDPPTHRAADLRTKKSRPEPGRLLCRNAACTPYFFVFFLSAAYSSLTLASTTGVILSVESASISAVALMMSLYFLSPLISCTARCSRSCARLVKT